MTSNFLMRLLKRGSGPPRPQVDMHALFTSSQMSTMILQGQLSVHEPWRRNKKKPKIIYACLYTNDSSPFIVWYTDKAHKKPRGFFNIRGGKIAPVGEFSFQIAFKDQTSQIYKFNTSTWERREEWLHLLRKESRKEVQMPLIETICKQDYHVSQDDLAITQTADQKARQQQLRPSGRGIAGQSAPVHRRRSAAPSSCSEAEASRTSRRAGLSRGDPLSWKSTRRPSARQYRVRGGLYGHQRFVVADS
ncbi:uncharacterized protein LOC110990148 isoform X1 [Acanthaster planci]|uniref:Uncharacterized protein LOC110990148 isoform X1 n=1 Tax=Acanthaster planci TaxID=133434 RepID=A0A8B8A007_ACAPL|nr:uncharacterized protein LOC110990148 isoform X1 [Acanthaster planci]XP_022110691.1 uncharacterized protein LOC110990148 isoform X1 [Acanthaster planci]XP_022110692.1 uncharacterized protein LOC110990148 isoform X1 [Acanthaster planci]XP_022110693.1 uncharacterized protein LOC110990148 isoform X1 [Acanthaster planci]XP_022110694.1 uncharacterized protein LOC110990148 isoform X1 [Acanthaster planci]